MENFVNTDFNDYKLAEMMCFTEQHFDKVSE